MSDFCKDDYYYFALNHQIPPQARCMSAPIASILAPTPNYSIGRILRCNLKLGRLSPKSNPWSTTTSRIFFSQRGYNREEKWIFSSCDVTCESYR